MAQPVPHSSAYAHATEGFASRWQHFTTACGLLASQPAGAPQAFYYGDFGDPAKMTDAKMASASYLSAA